MTGIRRGIAIVFLLSLGTAPDAGAQLGGLRKKAEDAARAAAAKRDSAKAKTDSATR